jgi:endonuclease/exonuclease/phosphatase family metal-dependent hydrolase
VTFPHLRRLVVLLGTALALVVAGAPAPATAAVARPSVVVVPGNGTVTAEWKKIPGAKTYQLQVSTTKSFSKKTTVTVKTSKTVKMVSKLKVYKKHYVRVRALTGVRSAWSAVKKTEPTRRSVGAVKVTVTGAGTNKIKVSWPRLARGTKVVIMPTYSNDTIEDAKNSWKLQVPATRTSATVTIPPRFAKLVGSATGNPVYVRVLFYNATTRNRSNIAYGWATPQAVAGNAADRVTIASYNVGSVGATASIPNRAWPQRRTAVANTITKAGADVVAVQEASTAQVVKGEALMQYQDLQRRVAGAGYSLAVPSFDKPPAGVSRAEHLLYKKSRVTVVKSGFQSVKALAGRYASGTRWVDANGKAEGDRQFSWALFRSVSSGTYFYVASIHLEQGSSSNTQAVRRAAAAGIRGFLSEQAARDGHTSAPAVIAGDWNTDVERYPASPVTDSVLAGYRSAAATHRFVNAKYASANARTASVDHGYPAKPYKYTYVGPRIDHIMVKNGDGSVSYTNQIVTKSGKFDPSYQGSDHNLQLATLALID